MKKTKSIGISNAFCCKIFLIVIALLQITFRGNQFD